MTEENNQKKSFKGTLNLPTTDFPIRPNHKENDMQLLERWKNDDVAKKAFLHNHGAKKFILHDGPPYANGHTHIGHAYNKILKDIVAKAERMQGNHVPVTPGWDCHGLPIEFAVKKENPMLTGPELKKACRKYASQWIDIQKEEFKQLGVFMDWDNPYLTMDYSYEADTIRAFGSLVEQNYIERKNKTVPWCPTCQTVLASAEIEYQDRKDPSLYVLFTLTEPTQKKLLPHLQHPVSLLVWTTTPWTLPLNRAVLLKPHTEYVVLELKQQEKIDYIIVGKELLDAITRMLALEKNVIATLLSNNIVQEHAAATHPFIDNFTVPILLDESVLTDDGTACVHSAPGAGPIDYEIGVKNGLEIYSPITVDGRYTHAIHESELIGMSVTDAQGWVIKKLQEKNKLAHKASITHSYPHCWRCRGGLIFRATKQWFCDLSRNDLKAKAIDAINSISMIPQNSHNRFEATVGGRLEWCLSRQRTWGVPIPAFICNTCDYTYITSKLIHAVAQQVAKKGIEYWDTVTLETMEMQDLICNDCGGTSFTKETDILDVWFDSGISHYAVLSKNPELAYPADIYLEGKDQHRGWFQSSLLTSSILEKTPCFKTLITHGFTVDERGRKMSKSLGNVVSPQEMIDKLGTDGLRLWAASIDTGGDAVVSDILLKNIQEVFRKIRNTCRFLLSNIYDFDINCDAIAIENMMPIDQLALQELFGMHNDIVDAYKTYDFTRVAHVLSDYCASDLSSFYLDIIKDRLYVEKSDGILRRSAQTVCYHILDTLTKMMAPILSFTAEQLSEHYQKEKTESIHLQNFPQPLNAWETVAGVYISSSRIESQQTGILGTNAVHETQESGALFVFVQTMHKQWDILKKVRSALLKSIEIQREQQIIKHSLEARVTIYIDPKETYATNINTFIEELQKRAIAVESFFKEFIIISQFVIAETNVGLIETELKGLYAHIEHAQGSKCPRCWNWDINDNPDQLCHRCIKILAK